MWPFATMRALYLSRISQSDQQVRKRAYCPQGHFYLLIYARFGFFFVYAETSFIMFNSQYFINTLCTNHGMILCLNSPIRDIIGTYDYRKKHSPRFHKANAFFYVRNVFKTVLFKAIHTISLCRRHG